MREGERKKEKRERDAGKKTKSGRNIVYILETKVHL